MQKDVTSGQQEKYKKQKNIFCIYNVIYKQKISFEINEQLKLLPPLYFQICTPREI